MTFSFPFFVKFLFFYVSLLDVRTEDKEFKKKTNKYLMSCRNNNKENMPMRVSIVDKERSHIS